MSSQITLTDTHCHIHSPEFQIDGEAFYQNAINSGVNRMLLIGTSASDSQQAVDFADNHQNLWAVIGHHPHEADNFSLKELKILESLCDRQKVVGIGEIGIDYFYGISTSKKQKQSFKEQLELGVSRGLPFSFHIRGSKENPLDAFNDAFEIIDNFPKISAVVHSFSADTKALELVNSKGFYFGINGIMTFTKNDWQLEAFRKIDNHKILLETDAPFLAPKPYRGKKNQPAYLVEVAQQIAELRGQSVEDLANFSNQNATKLFGLEQ